MASAPDHRYPIAVLVSGSGTNLQALIEACADPGYGAQIEVVVSDRPGVPSLTRAEEAGIPTRVVAWEEQDSRTDFTNAVCDAADEFGARALVLAGFMRILAPVAMERFPHRMLNTHPALLPAFPGAHAIAEALSHRVKVTGVTIHFLDEQVDHGPIVLQEPVAVLSDDTEETLQARIQAVEHRVYPEVVDALARGKLSVVDRTVTWMTDP